MAWYNPLTWKNRKYDEQTNHNTQNINYNYSIFRNINDDIKQAIASRSVVDNTLQDQFKYINPTWQTDINGKIIALPLNTNKSSRIDQYRIMAKFPEIEFCLDEIADDFFHEDENGNIINLFLPDVNEKPDLNDTRQDILQNEFRKFINMFKFYEDGHALIKRFMIEGELAWENVIKKEYSDYGIIGIRFLPAEYYETLLDCNTKRPIGIVFDTKKLSLDIKDILSTGYTGAAQIFNNIIPTINAFSIDMKTCIPMLWSQLTYINSGEYALDGTYVVYPIMEKARQAYQQLSLLQDSAIIYRVTRSPERLLFNISTGNMPQNVANDYIRNFMNDLKSKRVSTGNGTNVGSTYDPVSMLESYYFGRSNGNDGTSVESVGSSNTNFDQLADIEFFLRRLLKQFKIPFSRYKTPENTYEKNDTITYEEYSFSRLIIRYQRRLALGLKNSFITHLKLRGLWDKYNLDDADITVKFNPPVLYDLYEQQKQLQIKIDMYTAAVSDNENLSKTLAMKKYLGYTEAEIEDNYMNLIKEKQLIATGDYWKDKTTSEGPLGKWSTPPIGIKGITDKKDENQNENNTNGSGDNTEDNGSSEDANDQNSEDNNQEQTDQNSEGGEEQTPPEPATFGLS